MEDEAWRAAAAVMGVLGAKWVLRVLRALQPRPLRYNELMRGLPGIHPTVLAATLRRMQAAGLLERRVDPGPPAAVTYLLTSLAYDALPLVMVLASWVWEHEAELIGHEAWE